ncbi:unannotated protein [freshwater metagenome]|uniref:Unannotated protein n=1 Tax=freshwater metagenome TaxID=449393 RepID=A0A6J7CWV0_9ZZZZ|nr:folate-binding protein [Actinomycetota bacterium]
MPKFTGLLSSIAMETGWPIVVDCSDRGKLALSGDGAVAALNAVVTNDVEALSPGSGLYAAVLTGKGGMLGDLRVLRTADGLLLDTERVALQDVFDVLRRGLLGYDAQLGKRTLECGLLRLAGPGSRAIAGAEDLPDEEHAHLATTVGGLPVRLIATDVGVDVLCDAAETAAVTTALEAAGGVPAGEESLELLRIERGRPRFGVDIETGVIPQEAGLNERAVSFTKGCYIGQETVARLHYKGRPNRHLRGLRLSAPCPVGTTLHLEDREIGHLTSSGVSGQFGPIGLALLRREAEPGSVVTLGDGPATAEVVTLPF